MAVRLVKYFLFFLLVQSAYGSTFEDVRKYILVESDAFELLDNGNVSYMDYKATAEWLANKLSSVSGRWHAEESKGEKKATIQLLPLNNDSNIPYKEDDSRYKEAYKIEIDREIKIYAGGSAGAMYAAKKIIDLLENNETLESAILIGYPDYRWRGVVVKPANTSCGDPLNMSDKEWITWLDCMRFEIRKIAELRLNLLGLISPVFARMSDKDAWHLDELFDYARQNNLEPMPIIDTKLWGIPKDNLKVDAIEGIFHEARPFIASGGYLLSNDQQQPRAIKWVEHEKASKSWNDQSKKGDRWRISNNSKSYNDKPLLFTIDLKGNEDPWKTTLLLEQPVIGGRIEVLPSSYYELGIRAKVDSDVLAGYVSVTVSQYNKTGMRIKGLNNYPARLHTSKDKNIKRWIPVFISSDTESVLIRIAPGVNLKPSGKLIVSDIELQPMYSELINMLVNDETFPIVTSEDGQTIYESGVDYEIANVPIREWRDQSFEIIERTRIRIIPGSRIKEGDQVLLSYDSLPLEYRAIPRSKYSAVSKYSYEEYGRLFRQFAKLPLRFVKVNLSEHFGGLNRDSRSRSLGYSNRTLLIHFINNLERLLKSKGQKNTLGSEVIEGDNDNPLKLVIWDDMLNPWHNGGDDFNQVSFGGKIGATGMRHSGSQTIKLSKSVWLSSWWYGDNDKKGIVKHAPKFYSSKGYNFFVAGWYQSGGIDNWFKAADPQVAQGVLATTWNGNASGVRKTACLSWNRRNTDTCWDSVSSQ